MQNQKIYVIRDSDDQEVFFEGTEEECRNWWWDKLNGQKEVGGYEYVEKPAIDPQELFPRLRSKLPGEFKPSDIHEITTNTLVIFDEDYIKFIPSDRVIRMQGHDEGILRITWLNDEDKPIQSYGQIKYIKL